MDDWRTKIDRYKAQLEEKRKQTAEQAARVREEQENNRYKQQLSIHQSRFFCHICRKPSSGPRWKEGGGEVGDKLEWYLLWDTPEDLYLCVICRHWTCPEHYHNGICKKCAERL